MLFLNNHNHKHSTNDLNMPSEVDWRSSPRRCSFIIIRKLQRKNEKTKLFTLSDRDTRCRTDVELQESPNSRLTAKINSASEKLSRNGYNKRIYKKKYANGQSIICWWRNRVCVRVNKIRMRNPHRVAHSGRHRTSPRHHLSLPHHHSSLPRLHRQQAMAGAADRGRRRAIAARATQRTAEAKQRQAVTSSTPAIKSMSKKSLFVHAQEFSRYEFRS